MTRRWGVALVFVATVAVVAGGVVFGGVVAASHGGGEADYTVEPIAPEDRQPGATNVKYGQSVVSDAGVDLRTLEQTTAVFEEGSWENCGPGDGEIFGIDRGSTYDGYETDESLESNVKRFSAESDVFQVEFYGEDDFGESTYFDDGDELISVARCLNNPDEPGWYQISGTTTGVTENGEQRTFGGESHYFYVCDCEDGSEARAQLGPPPSEPESTPTPEPSESADNSPDGETDPGTDEPPRTEEAGSGAKSVSTETTDGEAGPERTATDAASTPASTPASNNASGSAQTESEWKVVNTPTPGDGAGFGGLSALVAALTAVSLLARRR